MTGRIATVALAGALAWGCGTEGPTVARFGDGGSGDGSGSASSTSIPARAGSVVVEGCQLDTWQTAALQSPSAQAVIKTVILLCPTLRDDGTVAPAEGSAQGELQQQLSSIKSMGYWAHLAVTMTDELGQPYDAGTMQASLASASWRTKVVSGLAPFANMADGLDLQLPPPPDASRDDVTSLVQALSTRFGASSLAIFVPPGGASNDVAGAPAYDLASIGALVSRVHVLTLDYSCCGGTPGPTIDSGWAVDVMNAAASETGAPLDLAVPLYGWDFGPNGQQSAVSFVDAQGVASDTGASMQRGPTGALYYDWQDDQGGAHETWFDDATSTSWTLAAWDAQTVPPTVGVVFWGLGDEDPTLWDTLASEVSQ